MAAKIELPALHKAQREVARSFAENRRVVLRCGRRWGKTTLLERTALKLALKGRKVGWFGPQYRLNTPTYQRLGRLGAPMLRRRSQIDQILEFHGGGSVEFWTLLDPDAGRSRFYDLVIIDEASLIPKGLIDIWQQSIAPTLLDRGGSAIMAGTPKGIDPDNYFYWACSDPKTEWLQFYQPTMTNPTLKPEEVARLKTDYPPLVYQQEYLAEFVDWSGAAFFNVNWLLIDGKPLTPVPKPDQIFQVIDTAMRDGMEHDGTACITFAKYRHGGAGAVQLVIVDYDILSINAELLIDWLPGKIREAQEFANFTEARYGYAGTWIEDAASGIVLLGEARRRGLPVEAIDTKLISVGKEGRALAASGYVSSGKVKISEYAFNKIVNYRQMSKNHLIDQLATFRIGMKRREHNLDLIDCFTYGISIALGDGSGW